MVINALDHINLQKLGQLLQKARKRCLMTQAEAAQVINASRTTMVALEKGERRIKAGELIKLARAYQCDLSDLLCTEPLAELLEVQFQVAFRQTDSVFNRHEQETTEIQSTILQLEELGLQPLPAHPDMTPIHYQLAIEALDQGLITEGRFAKFLRVDRLEARRIADILREHFSNISNNPDESLESQ